MKNAQSEEESKTTSKSTNPVNSGKSTKTFSKSRKPASKSTKSKEVSRAVLITEPVLGDKRELIGYILTRSISVLLPDGTRKLFDTGEGGISIDFTPNFGLLPAVLRIAENENSKCPDFVTKSEAQKQHSVESKIKKYLIGKSSIHEGVAFMHSGLKSSTIISKSDNK